MDGSLMMETISCIETHISKPLSSFGTILFLPLMLYLPIICGYRLKTLLKFFETRNTSTASMAEAAG